MNEIEATIERAARALPHAGPGPATLEALGRRARRAGLVDISYAQVDSPMGPLTVAATGRGLVTLSYPENPVDEVLERLAREVSPRILESPSRLDGVRRELDGFFAGRRRSFKTPVDLSLTRGFTRRVLEATAQIGFGETSTYREVAAAAGSERAARAAGNGLGANPIAIVVPCHRVLHTGGGLGGYTGGLDRKRFLLEIERG